MNYRLSIEQVDAAYACIGKEFINTPQYINEALSSLVGCELVLKVETLNPIRSFKARGTDYLISLPQDTELVCASAGNFGQAIAYSACRKGVKVTVFASHKANPLKIERMKAFGANVVLSGNDFDTAKENARQFAKEKNIRFVEDSLDIETLAGAGTIGRELLAFPKPIDALIIPLGNGALINGIARVYKHYSPSTKIVAVQASGAPAMVESWREGRIVEHKFVNTIADGIAVRTPVPQALIDMQGLIDDAILVTEESILEAMKLLHIHGGIVAEPSGAVGLAAVLENTKLFAGKTVATLVCGGNLTEQQMKMWLQI
jgi:threonine dehydratase